MEFERSQLKELRKRLLEPRGFIQVVQGPRQVGKTTMVQQLLAKLKTESLYASADEAQSKNAFWLEQQWQTARLRMKQQELEDFILVIDEIHQLPEWSSIVKKLWDQDSREKRSLKLIALGSSRLLVEKGLTESLAGRFETIIMPHWSLSEMKKAFGFSAEQYAWYGSYPGIASLIKDESRWKNYILHSLIETTISKDILLLNRVDKPALLKHLFEMGCNYSGQIFSYNKMLGQLHEAGNTTTLAHYLDLLSTAGMLSGLSKFSGAKVMSRNSSPKFQVQNTALHSVYSGMTLREVRSNPMQWGRWVESAVGSHLLHLAAVSSSEIYYWRDGNYEVDFVVKSGKKICAIEVKTAKARMTSGLQIFSERYHPQKNWMVGEGGLKWEEFLLLSLDDLF